MKRWHGMLRVFGLGLAIVCAAATLTLRSARAHLVESLRGFGDQIARLHDVSPVSAPRRLMLNGLELHVMTATTRLDVTRALDRFQSVCRSVGQLDLPATIKQKLEPASPELLPQVPGIIREDTEHEGFLACIDLGQGLDGEGFLARLTEFGKTKNLRTLGQLRYALARRSEESTTLIMFWTEGDAKLTELFPQAGDAPGSDLWGMPRPKGSKRTLSAFEEGMPYGLATYHVAGHSRAAVSAEYESLLKQQGWTTRTTKSGNVIARKADRTVLVQTSEKSPGQVLVGLSDLG